MLSINIKNLKTGILAGFFTAAMSIAAGNQSFAAIPLADLGFTANSEQIQAVTYQYNMIPASIRQYYEDSGNKIYFFETSETIDDLLGAYSGQEGQQAKIILTNRDYGGAEAITHEMGHFFDDICYTDEGTSVKTMRFRDIVFYMTQDGKRYISDTDEFNRIYLYERKNAPVTKYEKTDANEYFAGSFGLYCTDPDTLMTYAPYTYAYIDKLVNNFTNIYPASAENIALTVTMPATIDELTGGATTSGIYIANGNAYTAHASNSESVSTFLGGNVSQISGVTSQGVSYTGYTNVDTSTEAGAANAGQQIQNATAAAQNGEGTTTVVNPDGSITTTTVKQTEYGTMVSVVRVYSN
ncbi:anthrax toxin lethal factor-related metalloendopeptidase [Oribacterium sp. P6A1]|uniref:anthrax toxin lethal factor-related metalloendopeptidase n=1 Tax=Oribacterium sp. P6A1 TaxID=1410612 RepID=UPI00055B8398|nr:hypothetical protein [Oribacterium sp. P6A1]